MSRRTSPSGAVLIYGLAAGLVLLIALGLIGMGLARMTASDEATPFRSACQGDDACRQALIERLPRLQAAPGGVAAWTHEALSRSAPALAPDATLAACQATGTPESCALDPAKLKPGEAGALVAVFDAYSLALGRQARACRYLEGCATRALAALGEYAFDPARIQGALQRTSHPLPPALKACADAPPDTLGGACEADGLLRAAPEPLTVALEQDWRSGGAQARLPRPPDPQAETLKNALWAGLGAGLGMLAVGAVWATTLLIRSGGKDGLTTAAQAQPLAAEAPPMSALAPRTAAASRAPSGGVGDARIPPPRAPGNARPAPTPFEAAPEAETDPPNPPLARPSQRRISVARQADASPAGRPAPAPALAAFQVALSIPGDGATFTRLAMEEAARLSPRFDDGERLAAGAILAAHRLRGDRPVEAHAGAYDDLVSAVAGPGPRLVWPRPGAPITAEMDTCDDGDLYSHTVEAVVRPGLAEAGSASILRARVRAR